MRVCRDYGLRGLYEQSQGFVGLRKSRMMSVKFLRNVGKQFEGIFIRA